MARPTIESRSKHRNQANHLNTPRLVADAAGATVWKWDQQEPFGDNVADENPSGLGAFDLPLRFLGQRFDQETGLHYNYYRDFDPTLGNYKQSDPIGLRGGLNTYAYSMGNPIVRSDPYGLWPFGAPGRSNAESIAPGELQRLVPELTKQEAEQLSQDAIEEVGWSDVASFPPPIPSTPPKTWGDLTDEQKQFIKHFLDRLPNRNKTAIEKVKNYCEAR